MIVEEQISARQQRARKAIQKILTGPVGQAYGDYVVKSASGRKYRVAMRGPSLFENFCSCADFAVNTLGTCKHIEALLLCLRLKKALFTGLFDQANDEISFEKLGRKSMMHVIKDVFSDQPGRPKPALTPVAPQPVAVTEVNGITAAKNGDARGHTVGKRPQLSVDPTIPLCPECYRRWRCRVRLVRTGPQPGCR
jgi:predicted nucleic acid-binding Zn finger protein